MKPRYTFTSVRQNNSQSNGRTVQELRKFWAGEVLASVFWDSCGAVLLIIWRGETLTQKYYSQLFIKNCVKIFGKRCGMIAKDVLFLKNNAPANKSQIAN